MSKTLGQIKTLTWDAMVQKSTSTTYNTTKLGNAINELGDEMLGMKVFNDLTQQYILADRLYLNEGKVAIKNIGDIVLQADIVVGDVTITLDTTDLDSSGAILIDDEIITYTGKTATEVTGVSGILKEHNSGDTVLKLYVCPTTFYKPINVYSVNGGRKTIIPYQSDDNRLGQYYEIKKENGNQYIVFRGLVAGYYYVEYLKNYEYMTSDSDVSIFPDIVCSTIIPKIVGGRLIKDIDLKQQLLSEGFGQLANYFNRVGDTSTKGKGVTYKRFKFNSIK